MVPFFFLLAGSVILLWVSLWQRGKQRLLADLPTSKIQGIFIGLVELRGTAESESPLCGFLWNGLCVHHAYTVEEHWSRVVTETYTDKEGRTQTRTRHESGWETVASGGETQNFYLRDDTGVVCIRPEGATLETVVVFNERVSRGHPLYYGRGPSGSVADSDHERRFVEQAIPLHAPLYVVGQARERADVVAAEIAQSPDAPVFLISMRDEQQVQGGHSVASWVTWLLGLGAAGAAGVLMGPELAKEGYVRAPGLRAEAGAMIFVSAFLGLWGLCWTWMVFNSLVRLRSRVRQGWSLIEVQLKRRHDLIPRLASIVAALSSHEETVQTAVAELRAQMSATRPGVSGPDYEGLVPRLRAVVERYPALVAQEGFAGLHSALVETEQRIALARSYYNDIATQYATRLERIPDCWVARLGAMRPEPLLAAANFERAPVQVSLVEQPATGNAAPAASG